MCVVVSAIYKKSRIYQLRNPLNKKSYIRLYCNLKSKEKQITSSRVKGLLEPSLKFRGIWKAQSLFKGQTWGVV